jgi:ribose transport system substrate-binding protein
LAESKPQLRIKGFNAAIAKDPAIQIVVTEDARWDMAISERMAGNLFARFAPQGGLDAIFAMADHMAHGVIQAAKASNIPLGAEQGKLAVISSNCMKFGLTHIKSGEQIATATQLRYGRRNWR